MIGQMRFLPAAPLNPQVAKPVKETGAAEISRDFGAYLNDAMAQLAAQEAKVENLNGQFVSGNLSDVHQLMIASEKASLGLELTVQIRNKMIEAYQEIMKMQI